MGLNELEFVRGGIYANVSQTEWIVIIDPGTGEVTGRIDLHGLLSPDEQVTSRQRESVAELERRGGTVVDVPNGIA